MVAGRGVATPGPEFGAARHRALMAAAGHPVEETFRKWFGDRRLIIASNREPYEHVWGGEVGEVQVRQPAGGLTSALDPLLQALGGTWVAWGSGDADAAVVDPADRCRVPPESPAYTLRRVWLTQRDINRYYLGYANEFLWPLCHLRPDLTRVRERYWERYQRVNLRFADAVLEEAAEGPAAVWFQDYHLALAPERVRARRPDLSLAHFWHIPWPPIDVFRIAPQAEELIRGLLANDLMGFHLPHFVENFLRAAEVLADAEVDWNACTARLAGHVCHVRALPISIDAEAFRAAADAPSAADRPRRLRARYAPDGARLGVGVDRLDYSKGLPEKFKALAFLWERYPEHRGTFTFVQVAVPSRSEIVAYEELERKVDAQVQRLNERFGTESWTPVHLIKQSLPTEQLAVLYRAADLCIVSSLQDGMNLVAKEYVASQGDAGDGVLLLSRFAGAAESMNSAMLINPFDPEDFARRIHDALTLPSDQRQTKMRRLQTGATTIYDWMRDAFSAWGEVVSGK